MAQLSPLEKMRELGDPKEAPNSLWVVNTLYNKLQALKEEYSDAHEKFIQDLMKKYSNRQILEAGFSIPNSLLKKQKNEESSPE